MRYADIIPYIENKLVTEQKHPAKESLRIFNYSQKCQFDRIWDDVTRNCRGLIMDIDTGEVIARPFPKFFNYGEHISNKWPIPGEMPQVMEKVDGSLGILYNLKGEPWIATRGSFVSDQAKWATEWFRKNIGYVILKDETNLFEIIYPQNRIVVKYDFSGLVYLTTIETSTGRAKHRPWNAPIFNIANYPFTSFEELEKKEYENAEGFVLFFPDSNVRMKIKLPEYVRLHKLITGVSEIAIWEHMRDGKRLDDLLEKVPDEFYKWVHATAEKLGRQFEDIRFYVNDFMAKHILEFMLMSRKEVAEVIAKEKYAGLLFAALDGKDYEPKIWRMVRPHGNAAFKVDIDS